MSTENKLFDNKQLIHIASEVVVLLGMAFYFSSKNKALQSHIENLAQRLEEQEDRIQKLENIIQQMSSHMAQIPRVMEENKKAVEMLLEKHRQDRVVETFTEKPKKVKQPEKQVLFEFRDIIPKKHTTPIITEFMEKPKNTKVQFIEEDEEISDSELDEEIEQELQELKQDENNLKKEN